MIAVEKGPGGVGLPDQGQDQAVSDAEPRTKASAGRTAAVSAFRVMFEGEDWTESQLQSPVMEGITTRSAGAKDEALQNRS